MTLLGPAEIRELAAELGVRPTKQLGQNFVHDPNTVRRIVRAAELSADDVALEVGPGLGSLTLGLLEVADKVCAVEIDPVLAKALPATVQRFAPEQAGRLHVIEGDALRVDVDQKPTALVANLPYNVAVPVVLHLLATLPSLRKGLVMVQKEVADRLVAGPGSRVYGVPSVKLAWYATAKQAGKVPPSVFWPVPNVDSGLVAFTRRETPLEETAGADAGNADAGNADAGRKATFAVVDAAFAQRRKTLRAALAGWAGGPDAAERILRAAGVDPGARGEQLTVHDFTRIASQRQAQPSHG
ncbi:16S rRNA (adenine(1518)-N(6)/adenine(1519)-N(6))-dimethyltransferase RsmA [Dactylosporangium sp. NPDC050588]|uniref:16S rRNA (adenine(1518)-N(6)/adenine(1519)-N(6))- dimethyltransferase RsmA n=1 Tax=Dactylosporangium sp. NPDC050588 TaxID=3157211 RepID=UPI0034074861